MYSVVLLSVLGACGPNCDHLPPEWCACRCPATKGGLVVLHLCPSPGVGPAAEREWMDYICALETWEQHEYMVLWHKADLKGKLCLLNQVRLMRPKIEMIFPIFPGPALIEPKKEEKPEEKPEEKKEEKPEKKEEKVEKEEKKE